MTVSAAVMVPASASLEAAVGNGRSGSVQAATIFAVAIEPEELCKCSDKTREVHELIQSARKRNDGFTRLV
jgi:hypothetical protein